MNRRHTTALLFLMLTIHLYAASADSTLVEFNTLWNTVRQPAWQNPALHGKAFKSSLTQLYAEADWQQQSEAFVQEKEKDSYCLLPMLIPTFGYQTEPQYGDTPLI